MGRAQQPTQSRQIPINGGGYVPPPVQVKRQPFVMDNIKVIILAVVLLALFAVGLAMKIPILLWIYVALAVAGIALLWVRPGVESNRKISFTIIFAALAVVAVVSAMPRPNSGGQDGAPSAPASQTTSPANAVVDPRTGQAITTVEELPTDSPAPAKEDNSATERLELFFNYWAGNKEDDMLTLCSPAWRSNQDNPSSALFGLKANRTPLDYYVEKISGTSDDTSRTVTVVSTMDRNNGKDPVKYRLSVLMVKEGDEWYVDPQSLKTYESAETPDPESVTATPTKEPEYSPSTVLYYNPDGGSQYHLDQNCKSTHARYLPFKGHFTYAEINNDAYKNLQPCNVCGAPLRP